MSASASGNDPLNHAREFWSQNDNGRDFCVAITFTDADAAVVWAALKRARDYVEERVHTEAYRGRFIRSWSEADGVLYKSDLEERGISTT